MAAPLKYFIDGTSPLWMGGALVDSLRASLPRQPVTRWSRVDATQHGVTLIHRDDLCRFVTVHLSFTPRGRVARLTAESLDRGGSQDGKLSDPASAVPRQRLARLALMEIPS